MLKAGHPRFEVGFLSAAHPLIAKRVLIRRVAVGSNYLCKIHPAVIERREDIIQSLDAALKRHG
jgi:hypothetical protein